MTNFKLIETASVQSSNIVEVGYTDTNALFVLFKGGGSYLYLDVPKETYEELKKAESAGKYLYSNIKPNFKFEALSKAVPKKKEEKVEVKPVEVKPTSVTITASEIMAKGYMDVEQPLLEILKEKGAPIEGIFLLEYSKEYEWTKIVNKNDDTLTITWRKAK